MTPVEFLRLRMPAIRCGIERKDRGILLSKSLENPDCSVSRSAIGHKHFKAWVVLGKMLSIVCSTNSPWLYEGTTAETEGSCSTGRFLTKPSSSSDGLKANCNPRSFIEGNGAYKYDVRMKASSNAINTKRVQTNAIFFGERAVTDQGPKRVDISRAVSTRWTTDLFI